MPEPKWTAGPWRAGSTAISTTGFVAANNGKGRVIADNIEKISDARLIAAAPELYAELAWLIRNCGECAGFGQVRRNSTNSECTVCKVARAVLAKARGEIDA